MKSLNDIDTPAVLIDLYILSQNLCRTVKMAKDAKVKLPPNCKTHKSIWIAKNNWNTEQSE